MDVGLFFQIRIKCVKFSWASRIPNSGCESVEFRRGFQGAYLLSSPRAPSPVSTMKFGFFVWIWGGLCLVLILW
jgi:hypothetical protein